MRFLVDTHLLIWAANSPARLSPTAAALIADMGNELMFSTVSVAEVSIKWALGRPDFRVEPRDFRSLLLLNGFEELALTGDHACGVGGLPRIHKDPFDRMLIAQAMVEGVELLTVDAALTGYGATVRVVG